MKQSSQTPLVIHSRVGVIGDIHTEAELLLWALGVLRGEQVERVLATGDIVDGPHDADGAMRACRTLHEASALSVLGNHDRWLLDNDQRDLPQATFRDELDAATLEYLQSLPGSVEVETPLGLMLLGHGLGADDMTGLHPHDHGRALTDNEPLQALLKADHYRLVLGGHTHRRMVRRIGGTTFINAGTIMSKREPCCLLLDFSAKRAQFFDYTKDGKTALGPGFDL
jgi:predicted phosphodiesterase